MYLNRRTPPHGSFDREKHEDGGKERAAVSARVVERVKIAVTGELPPRKAHRINTGGRTEPSDWWA